MRLRKRLPIRGSWRPRLSRSGIMDFVQESHRLPNEFKDSTIPRSRREYLLRDLAGDKVRLFMLYIFDNCGESQMDKVLIRLPRRWGKGSWAWFAENRY